MGFDGLEEQRNLLLWLRKGKRRKGKRCRRRSRWWKSLGSSFMTSNRGFVPLLIYASRFSFINFIVLFCQWLEYPWIDDIAKTIKAVSFHYCRHSIKKLYKQSFFGEKKEKSINFDHKNRKRRGSDGNKYHIFFHSFTVGRWLSAFSRN